MNSGAPQVPDLASILQTLAAYTPRHEGKPDLEEGEYDPSEYDPTQSASAPPSQAHPFEQPDASPSAVNPTQSAPKAVPPPSPSAITTWPKALNYTMKYIFSDSAKKRRIQHLIETQHRHEREWWASREELIRKAQGRDKSRMELDSVLASVGGLAANSSRLQGEAEGDELIKELAIFDRKVHFACRQMVDAAIKEIRELGLPFYCAGLSDKVEKEELKSLREKMLQFLEDSCGPDTSED